VSQPTSDSTLCRHCFVTSAGHRSERCGHCHTCVNPQLKQACLTVRARQEAEARARVRSHSTKNIVSRLARPLNAEFGKLAAPTGYC
jgi:hypothetical protein